VRGGRYVCLDVIFAVTGDGDRLSAEGIAHAGIISRARIGGRPPHDQRSDPTSAHPFPVGLTVESCPTGRDEHPNRHPEYAIRAFIVGCVHET
jgi:hypothetical protein